MKTLYLSNVPSSIPWKSNPTPFGAHLNASIPEYGPWTKQASFRYKDKWGRVWVATQNNPGYKLTPVDHEGEPLDEEYVFKKGSEADFKEASESNVPANLITINRQFPLAGPWTRLGVCLYQDGFGRTWVMDPRFNTFILRLQKPTEEPNPLTLVNCKQEAEDYAYCVGKCRKFLAKTDIEVSLDNPKKAAKFLKKAGKWLKTVNTFK